ncbi:glycosyltransferase family 2 protein [Catellatospora tritici]|uniref:glycosyltransferase family 2 protein n=1 Tax=Catellatospora tritici TaxID=2851566 RepID=UPI001C2D1090|nr:glycosyltransferase [Catellatospora tritici]MBV1855319.1 glycosyltransferase [Catellatospora tritici]
MLARAPGRLSVLIPTYGDAYALELVLRMLDRQTLAPDRFEVVVVNDGSDPLPYQPLLSAVHPYELRFDTLPAHQGRAAARNRAVALATGDVICFLDGDVLAEPTLLARHLEFHSGRDEPAVLIGKRYEGDWGVLAAAAAGEPVTTGLVSDRHEDFRFRVPGRDERPRAWLAGAPWAFALTNNVSMPRRVVLDVGGFDEAYGTRWGFEDTDLAYRIHRHLGGDDERFCYDAAAVGFHLPAVRDLTHLQDDYLTNLKLFRDRHRDLAAELVDLPAPTEVSRKIRYYRRMLALCAEQRVGWLPDAWPRVDHLADRAVLCQAFGTEQVDLGAGSATLDHGRDTSETNLHLLGVWTPFADDEFDAVVSVDLWRFLEQRELSRFLRQSLRIAREVVLIYTEGAAARIAGPDLPVLTTPDLFLPMLRRRYPQAVREPDGSGSVLRIPRA